MNEQYKFIFDMDGTLYEFDDNSEGKFAKSLFYKDLYKNVLIYFQNNFKLTRSQATEEFERIDKKYSGEISMGLVNEYNIDRLDYFNQTWDLNPEIYIKKNAELPKILSRFRHCVLLTAAPKIWADKVLSHLEINLFFERMYTGETDIRKPNPMVFKQIENYLRISPSNIFSIGDQEYSDILPAKSLGMKTIRIGRDVTSKADYQVSNISEVINLLRDKNYL
ncbi:MAG TPA: HAD family hydrolase [Patescibacteria group bacterium]|nr:HAD family hydrolase [Patescibacteria group bacterium]